MAGAILCFTADFVYRPKSLRKRID
jgi:hypothetical protein